MPLLDFVEYPDDGYYIFRRSDHDDKELHTVFLNRKVRGPHGHWDAMSFVLHYNGKPFLIDSGGPYRYSNPYRYKYFQTQLAHNSVLVDRDPRELVSTLLDTQSNEKGHYALLGARLTEELSWVRCLGQSDTGRFIALDFLLGRCDQQITSRFHIDPDCRIEVRKQSSLIEGHGERLKLITTSQELGSAWIDSRLEMHTQKVPKHAKVPLEDRERQGLDLDFDRKSYVTYQDNQKVVGNLHEENVPINAVTMRLIQAANRRDSLKIAVDGDRVTVTENINKRELVAIVKTFDGLRFGSG